MTIEAVLALSQALVLERLINSSFLEPFLVRDGKMLLIVVLPLVVFCISQLIYFMARTHREQKRFWIITCGGIIVVLMMLGKQIDERVDGPQPRGIQDGALQTEEAVKFLLRGVNPYQADYSATAFGYYPNPVGNGQPNQAWTHYAYPPAQFLLAVPFVAFQPWLGGWFDGRTAYLVVFGLLVFLLIKYQPSWALRTRIALLTFGNPVIWLSVMAGFNDVLYIVGLLVASWGVMAKRWTIAGLAIAMTIGAKQSAWIVLPLLAWWIWARYRQGYMTRAALKRISLMALAGALAIFLPFVIWDSAALYDDLIRYVTGGYANTYPIAGPTLMQYWRVLGLAASPVAPVPSGLFQAMAMVPLFAIFGLAIWRRPTLQAWLTSATILSLVFFLLNRYFYTNYLSAIVLLGVGAYALSKTFPEAAETPADPELV